MAKTKQIKKKIENKTHAGTGHVCGECSILILNKENRNYKGEPFFGYCEHATFATSKDGRRVFLDDNPACDAFAAGEKENAKEKGGKV